MLPPRLARLSRLTQGLALVGLGVSAPACGAPPVAQEAPRDGELHINAPPTPPATATAAPSATTAPSAVVAETSADAGAAPAPLPDRVNSPPPARPGPPAQAPMPDHVNSPPPAKPALPKRVNSPPPSRPPTK